MPVRRRLDESIAKLPNSQPVQITLNRNGREETWSTTLSRPLDDLVAVSRQALGSEAAVNAAIEARQFPVRRRLAAACRWLDARPGTVRQG
ncbi:MAG: hypothetical protein R3B90_10495 [Planctomycetaceae bacterium]